MTSTPALRLAKHLLGESLGDWAVRHKLDDRSWVWISDRLSQETGGECALSPQYLGRLFGERVDTERAKRDRTAKVAS